MRTYCTVLGTPLSALWRPKWGGNPKKAGIDVYVRLIHFALQQKGTQHCQATNSNENL